MKIALLAVGSSMKDMVITGRKILGKKGWDKKRIGKNHLHEINTSSIPKLTDSDSSAE